MSRLLPLPDRSTIAPEELADYDAQLARARSMRADRPDEPLPPYFAALLNSPTMAAGLMNMGRIVRTRGERGDTYTHAQREWVDQVLSTDWQTNVVQRVHLPDGLAVGVRLEAVKALRSGDEGQLDEEERFLTAYIRQVDTGTVTDESYAELRSRLGERGALEYTIFIGFLIMTIRLHQALGVPDPPQEEIDQMIREFDDGSRPLPDFRLRIR